MSLGAPSIPASPLQPIVPLSVTQVNGMLSHSLTALTASSRENFDLVRQSFNTQLDALKAQNIAQNEFLKLEHAKEINAATSQLTTELNAARQQVTDLTADLSKKALQLTALENKGMFVLPKSLKQYAVVAVVSPLAVFGAYTVAINSFTGALNIFTGASNFYYWLFDNKATLAQKAAQEAFKMASEEASQIEKDFINFVMQSPDFLDRVLLGGGNNISQKINSTSIKFSQLNMSSIPQEILNITLSDLLNRIKQEENVNNTFNNVTKTDGSPAQPQKEVDKKQELGAVEELQAKTQDLVDFVTNNVDKLQNGISDTFNGYKDQVLKSVGKKKDQINDFTKENLPEPKTLGFTAAVIAGVAGLSYAAKRNISTMKKVKNASLEAIGSGASSLKEKVVNIPTSLNFRA